MNLLLDLGNTRLKWAFSHGQPVDGSGILQRGIVNYDRATLVAWSATLQNQPIKQIRFSSVIAPEQEALVFAALAPLALAPQRFSVTPGVGSLRNGYATQETLGVDRWAAAMADFARQGFAISQEAWNTHNLWQDLPVQVREGDAVLHEGVCRGVDGTGALCIETAQGTERVISGDVSLRKV